MSDTRRYLIPALSVFVLTGHGQCVLAAPAGGSIVAGSGSISQVGNSTNIQQDTANMVVNWQTFNIQLGEQVNFNQPTSSSIALNRDFSGVPSDIFGDLNANGQVYLFNTAGILIGPSSNINVAGLFLSDMVVSDADFQQFTQGGSMSLQDANATQGGIQIEGAVTTSTRSGITVISQFIDNSGTLQAQDGNLNFAVAGGPIVVTDQSGLLGVQVSGGITQDISSQHVLLNNSGSISAINGDINIQIHYLDTLKLRAVKDTGMINAVGAGYGHIRQSIVLYAPVLETGAESPVEETVTEALGSDPESVADAPLAEEPSENLSALDKLVEDCQSSDPSDHDCVKKHAIKQYLGRLLIGGSLPD